MKSVRTKSTSLLLRYLILFLSFSLFPTLLKAQSYSAGYTKYQRGDFKGAERSLLQAINKEASNGSKINSWKLLGICQYMLGNKGGATNSFKEALEINTGIFIASGEVLDDGVITFFNKIKSEIIEAKKPPPPPPPPAPPPPPKPVAKIPVKKPTVPVAAIPVPGAVNSADDTGESPASDTSPKAGSKKGGTFIIVQSDTPQANVMIDGILAGGVGSEIEVDPGLIVVEVAAPGEDSKIQKMNAIKGQVNTLTVNLIKPVKIKPVAKKKPKKLKKIAKRKRKKPDEMFAENPGTPQRSGYNPASEFESDTATGASPYAPAAPAPYYGQPYQQPQMAMNDQDYDDRYETRAASHGNYFIAALPFGAGQFQNRAVGTGVLFFAGEAGGLFFYMSKNKEAKSAEAEIVLYQQDAQQNEEDKTEEEKEADAAYVKETQDYIVSTRSKAKLGLYGFGVLWVAGAVEAFINDPIAKAAKQPQRRNRMPGYGQRDEKTNTKLLPPEERYYKSNWHVHLVPESGTGYNSSAEQGLKLVWQLKF